MPHEPIQNARMDCGSRCYGCLPHSGVAIGHSDEIPTIQDEELRAIEVDPLMDTASKCPTRDEQQFSQTPQRIRHEREYSNARRANHRHPQRPTGCRPGYSQVRVSEVHRGQVYWRDQQRADQAKQGMQTFCQPPCLIAMKACGGAHHWARELSALGYSVRLLHAKVVRDSLREQAKPGLRHGHQKSVLKTRNLSANMHRGQWASPGNRTNLTSQSRPDIRPPPTSSQHSANSSCYPEGTV